MSSGDIVGYNECVTRFAVSPYEHTLIPKLFHPLLKLIAPATDRELAKYVEYLKE